MTHASPASIACAAGLAAIFAGGALAAVQTPDQPPQATVQTPSMAGVWELDSMMGGAPIGFQNERATCWSGGVDPRDPAARAETPDGAAAPDQMVSSGTFTADLTIEQTDASLSIDRRYGGSIGSGGFKGVYKLDGSESVNVVGDMTSRTRSRWNQGTFVIEGRMTTTKTGRPESVCTISETFEHGADGSLYVVSSGEVGGVSRTSRQTYFRRKR